MNVVEPHSPQESAVPLDLTPGQLLAAARREHHMSIADVANRLKLSVGQVEALEADAYDRLPGPVFVRGFMRNYARLVKLDSERLLRAVKVPSDASERPEKSEGPLELPLQRERRWPRYAAVAAAIFAIAAAIDFLWPESQTKVASSGAPVAADDGVQVPAQSSVQTVGQPSPAESAQGAVTVATAQGADSTTATAPGASSAASPSEPAVAARDTDVASASHAQVRLAFTERSWVEIRDRNGRVILSQLNSPGTTRELKGSAPLKLVIGNARGVRLMYNDRPVDLARYTRVDVARLTLE